MAKTRRKTVRSPVVVGRVDRVPLHSCVLACSRDFTAITRHGDARPHRGCLEVQLQRRERPATTANVAVTGASPCKSMTMQHVSRSTFANRHAPWSSEMAMLDARVGSSKSTEHQKRPRPFEWRLSTSDRRRVGPLQDASLTPQRPALATSASETSGFYDRPAAFNHRDFRFVDVEVERPCKEIGDELWC